MHYYDERGVARVYGVSLADRTWRFWRNAPEFAQRYTATLGDDAVIVGQGEMCRDGSAWEPDLAITYRRVG
jgi:hypothetical protein